MEQRKLVSLIQVDIGHQKSVFVDEIEKGKIIPIAGQLKGSKNVVSTSILLAALP